jgi:hypothetical protein
MVGIPILIDLPWERATMGAASIPTVVTAAPVSNVRRSKPILRLVIWISPYSISLAAAKVPGDAQWDGV